MKKTVYFLFAVLFAFAITACDDDENTNDKDNKKNDKKENVVQDGGKFYSETYKFKIQFPGKPDVDKEQETMEGFYVQTFMYDGGDKGNMVVSGRMNDMYAELFKGSEGELAISVRDATIQNLNAELTKEEDVDYKGIPSSYYEAKGELDGEDFYLKGINIIKNEFIYVIVVFRKEKEVEKTDYDYFINSFELVD